MRLVSNLLARCLEGQPLILKDTECLLKALSRHNNSASAKLFNFDVGDFFMWREHASLVETTSQGVDEQWREAYVDMLSFLLTSQYVTIPESDELPLC